MAHPPVLIPVSPGELIDRLTILQIKSERIPDAERQARVIRELELFEQTCRIHCRISRR